MAKLSPRHVAPIGALLTFAALIFILSVDAPQAPAAEANAAHVTVEVWAPNGTLWFTEPVIAQPPTALASLEAAAGMHGILLTVEDSPGFGDCAAYVRAIGQHEERGAFGWIVEVKSGDGEWVWVPRSASCYALANQDVVRWSWGNEG